MSAYNYAAAFLAFSQGSSFDDIAVKLGIPLETLKSEARQHGWKRLSTTLDRPMKQLTELELSLSDIQANRKQSLADAKPLEMLMGRTLDIYNRWWDELGVAEENHRACAALLDEAIKEEQQFYTSERRQELRTAQERLRATPQDDDLIARIVELQAPSQARVDAAANEKRAKEDRDELRTHAAPSPKALAELAKAVATIHDIRYRAVGDLVNKGTGEPPSRHAVAQIVVNLPGAISQPREKRVVALHPIEQQELGDGT